MRIGLLEIDQLDSETPKRLISKKKAHSLLARGYAKWVIDHRVLRMTRAEQLIRLDYRYLRNASEPVWIPFNRPREWKECLLLYYPHRSQESTKFAGQAGVNEWFGR